MTAVSAASSMSRSRSATTRGARRQLPVVRWLQAGAVAAGMGIALAAAPAALADDGANSATAGSQTGTSHSAHGSTARTGRSGPSSTGARKSASAVRQHPAAVTVVRSAAGQSSTAPTTGATDSTAGLAPVTTTTGHFATLPQPSVTSGGPGTPGTRVAVSQQAQPFGDLSAFLGLPGAPATSAPSLGALPILVNLTLEDLVSGTGPAAVTNPTAVITGLFNQIMRANPTATELQNYLGVFNLTGVNGVVAGLYSSTAFRQTEVSNYYLELLGRAATDQELAWGTTRLMWGLSEPQFAASLASTQEFYEDSAKNGGPLGPVPTSTSYVDLLYRTMAGTTPDATTLSTYVQRLQAGLPIGFVASDFVTSDAFRQAKIQEIYQVLGQTATEPEIAKYTQNWFWDGGLAGIATSLLTTSTNVANIENGAVPLPDMAVVAQLQQLLQAAYTANPDGFVKLYGTMVGNCSDTSSPACLNPALYTLLTSGGAQRGIPNSSLKLTSITANVATLIPTQNEIDLQKSLKFPLQDPASLQTYFTGGVVQPYANPIVTADNGTYIIDGHHRWSSIVLINPYTQVTALDMGYVPTPQDGLKEAQIGVAAVKGYLAVAPGGGINLYTTDEQTFDTAVRGYIETAADAHDNPPPPDKPSWTDQVLNVFTTYLGLDGQTTDQKYTSIQNYLWGNVLRMRELNQYIPNATSREVMPQTDPLPVTSGAWAGGALSYTFPTISYLG
ncbi:hypothetical protein [Mycolicibacterium anyangense]|uniref:hypothetical protein n=1 Tax=Mycolicibacterium anyangense TaxID=1431246 RepID=UPI0013D222FF|nr:hypothetical protein [Mycolicibacterium anyangense]